MGCLAAEVDPVAVSENTGEVPVHGGVVAQVGRGLPHGASAGPTSGRDTRAGVGLARLCWWNGSADTGPNT